MAKPDRTEVAHVMIGVRLTGWERVGLDRLAESESARLRDRLVAAGIPPKFIEPLTGAALVRSLIQREIEAADLDVADLKREAETAYPRPAPTARRTGPSAGKRSK